MPRAALRILARHHFSSELRRMSVVAVASQSPAAAAASVYSAADPRVDGSAAGGDSDLPAGGPAADGGVWVLAKGAPEAMVPFLASAPPG